LSSPATGPDCSGGAGPWPLVAGVPRVGRVATYDPRRGLGSVTETHPADDPSVSDHPFHSTAIADGSRAIDPGTPVAFVLVAGLAGTVEARNVTPIRVSGEG
jgi:cold shock CspA family protein